MFPTLAFEARYKSPIKLIQRILDILILCSVFTMAYLLRFDFSMSSDEIQKAFFQFYRYP